MLSCVCLRGGGGGGVQVERSKALLTSLGDERERWETGSQTFKSQMSTISGDVLLTSAFMAYGGEGFQGNGRKQWRQGRWRKGGGGRGGAGFEQLQD